MTVGEAKRRREAGQPYRIDPSDYPRIEEQTTRLTLLIAGLINSSEYNSVSILRAATNTIISVIAQMPEEVRDHTRAGVKQMFLSALEMERTGKFITNAPASPDDPKN
jgi:hypothetical protein